jgi:hypothetical protein
MDGFSEIGSVVLVLTLVFTGVTNELLAAFIVDSTFVSEAESEKSTIFFLSQRYYFVS